MDQDFVRLVHQQHGEHDEIWAMPPFKKFPLPRSSSFWEESVAPINHRLSKKKVENAISSLGSQQPARVTQDSSAACRDVSLYRAAEIIVENANSAEEHDWEDIPFVYFVPGNPGLVKAYTKKAHCLAKRLRAVVVVVGHRGHSAHSESIFSLANQIDHHTNRLTELIKGECPLHPHRHRKFILLGHSIGAHMAITVANRIDYMFCEPDGLKGRVFKEEAEQVEQVKKNVEGSANKAPKEEGLSPLVGVGLLMPALTHFPALRYFWFKLLLKAKADYVIRLFILPLFYLGARLLELFSSKPSSLFDITLYDVLHEFSGGRFFCNVISLLSDTYVALGDRVPVDRLSKIAHHKSAIKGPQHRLFFIFAAFDGYVSAPSRSATFKIASQICPHPPQPLNWAQLQEGCKVKPKGLGDLIDNILPVSLIEQVPRLFRPKKPQTQSQDYFFATETRLAHNFCLDDKQSDLLASIIHKWSLGEPLVNRIS